MEHALNHYYQQFRDGVAPRRILIVDDETIIALALQDGLKKLPNCEITIATCGEQALQLFERQPFDLLITDYNMPSMDGITLTTHVQQLHPQTATIMITAYGSDALHEQAARVSVQCILDKPVGLLEIRSAVLEVLGG